MLCSTNNFICLNLYKLLIFIFYFFNRKVRKGVAKLFRLKSSLPKKNFMFFDILKSGKTWSYFTSVNTCMVHKQLVLLVFKRGNERNA